MSESRIEQHQREAEQVANPYRLLDERDALKAEREQMLDLLERLVGADVLCLPDDQQSDDEAAATALLRQAGRNQPKEAR